MLSSAGGLGANPAGMLGSQGPALGIRSPAKLEVAEGESARIKASRDGSISFGAGQRTGSTIRVTQETNEPITPLKGRHVDAQA